MYISYNDDQSGNVPPNQQATHSTDDAAPFSHYKSSQKHLFLINFAYFISFVNYPVSIFAYHYCSQILYTLFI